MEKIAFLSFPNCYRLHNGTAEVIVSTDMGPRVLRYGFAGEDNVFAEVPDLATKTELGDWKPYAGHRLWAAPEAMPRSYAPDNTPITYTLEGDLSIRLTQPIDAAGLQKEMTVTLAPQGTGVSVQHRISNRTLWAIDLAVWASTVMNGGGETIVPQEPYRSHGACLDPARPLVLWYFTDLSDPRWTLGRKYIRLRTDPERPEPQKIGVLNKQGWCGYLRQGTLFVKRFAYEPGAAYTDYNSNNETYTTRNYMEVESLGAMRRLEPDQSVEHTEHWSLFRNVSLGATESAMEAALLPLIAGLSAA